MVPQGHLLVNYVETQGTVEKVSFGLGLDKLPDDGIVRDSDGGEDAVNQSGRPSAA